MSQSYNTSKQIVGPDTFANLVSQLDRGNIGHISQIQTARLRKEELRNISFYGGDGAVYGIKDGKPILYLTDATSNPLFDDPKESERQLIETGNFLVEPQRAKSLEEKANDPKDISVFSFNLSESKLIKYNHESAYISVKKEILTQGREALLKEHGPMVVNLFDRVHGNAISGEDGIGGLLYDRYDRYKKGLDQSFVTGPFILTYFLRPEYVYEVLKGKRERTMLARPSAMASFDFNSNVLFALINVNWKDHMYSSVG